MQYLMTQVVCGVILLPAVLCHENEQRAGGEVIRAN